jgi:hypothetical protein
MNTIGNVVRLPVGGRRVALRAPDGHDDLLLLESPATPAGDAALAAALAGRLAAPADRLGPLDAEGLCVTDLEALLLRVRQRALGDTLVGESTCDAPGCGRRIDVSFDINAYLGQAEPRPGPSDEPAGRDGWFVLRGSAVRFRFPTAADLAAVAVAADPGRALRRLCTDPPDVELTDALLDRLDAALERLAPALPRELSATCPECGAGVTVAFDPRSFCLRELRDLAASLFDDVAAIASRFHWPEREILGLPRTRRHLYAELARARIGSD